MGLHACKPLSARRKVIFLLPIEQALARDFVQRAIDDGYKKVIVPPISLAEAMPGCRWDHRDPPTRYRVRRASGGPAREAGGAGPGGRSPPPGGARQCRRHGLPTRRQARAPSSRIRAACAAAAVARTGCRTIPRCRDQRSRCGSSRAGRATRPPVISAVLRASHRSRRSRAAEAGNAPAALWPPDNLAAIACLPCVSSRGLTRPS